MSQCDYVYKELKQGAFIKTIESDVVWMLWCHCKGNGMSFGTEEEVQLISAKQFFPHIFTTVIPCYNTTLYKADFHIKQFFSDHQINPFTFQLIFPQYKVSL